METMTEYEVKSEAGDTLAILEAADYTDAELYTHRTFGGAARVVSLPSSDAREARLKESFTVIMGGDEKLADLAVAGRDSEPGPRRIVVPRQLAGGAHEELTEAQRQRQETLSDGILEEAFRDMGMSEAGVAFAVEGRQGKRSTRRRKAARQPSWLSGIAPKRKPPMAAKGSILGLGMGESEAEIDGGLTELTETFMRLGMSEAGAKIAAKGRERE